MRRVQIEPMPGEPAIAHAGRIALFLGVSSTQKFDQWLKREWNQGDKSATSSTRLAQLAGVAGMSLVDYARQHSLMGVLRVGARPSEMALHGAPEATNFTKRLGTHLAGVGTMASARNRRHGPVVFSQGSFLETSRQ